MRDALELVSASCVNVSLNVLVAWNFLNCKKMQVMQMLSISHWKNCRVESDEVTSVQIVNYILVFWEYFLWESESQIRSMASFLILRIHLHHDTWWVICKVDCIFLVQRYSDNVALPTDSLILVYSIKLGNGSVRIINEVVVSAIFSVVSPCQAWDRSHLMVMATFSKNEQVYRQATGKSHYNVQEISSGQDNAKRTQLESQ